MTAPALRAWGRYSLGLAQSCAPQETVCGDAWALVPTEDTLDVCLADGLGHGPEAHEASSRFVRICATHAGASLEALFGHAQQELAPTRGAAAAILRLRKSAESLELAAVGNVDIRFHQTRDFHPASTPGIVGRRVPLVRTYSGVAAEGALLVLFTDGISPGFDLAAYSPSLEPQVLADMLLQTHRVTRDDATCIVLRLEPER